MHPAVFLDRDNTLIHNDGDLGDPKQVQLIQGAASAVASLCGLGFKVVVVTNQGGVARGKYKEADVDRVHRRLAELLHQAANGARVDGFYFCPYHPDGKVAKYKREHPNRKPQPGMLLQAAEEMDLDLKRSWTIGDQVRDIKAGAAAGTRTILLRADAEQLAPLDVNDLIDAHDEAVHKDASAGGPNYYARTLIEAVRIIAQQRKPDNDQPPARIMAGERRWDAAAVAQLQREIRAKPARPTTAPAQGKPFRPWNLPPVTEEADKPADTPPKVEDAAPAQTAPIVEPPTAPPPQVEPEPEPEPIVAEATLDEPVPATARQQAAPEARLLRQILQELRTQRGTTSENQFGYLNVTAMVLQTIAAVCLLGALWMGAGNNDLFQRWALAGLLAQGATVALLLFARRG